MCILAAASSLNYLFRFASYKNGQHFREETGQEWVKWWLILEEAVKFHQQFFIFSQSVVNLAHIWRKQLTWYVRIPGRKDKLGFSYVAVKRLLWIFVNILFLQLYALIDTCIKHIFHLCYNTLSILFYLRFKPFWLFTKCRLKQIQSLRRRVFIWKSSI